MLFNYLFFDPVKIKNPVFIDSNLSVYKNAEMLFKDEVFSGIYNNVLNGGYTGNPYFYFCGTHNIPQLDEFANIDSFKFIKYFKTIDFYFFEPLTHYIEGKRYKYVPHILRTNNSDYDLTKIRSAELDSISEWADQNNLKNIRVFCTEYKSDLYYKNVYQNLKFSHLDVLPLSISKNILKSKLHYAAKEIDLSCMTKKFILPSWRYDPVRHIVVSFMKYKDIIKDSNVSFYFSIPNEVFMKKLWVNWNEFSFKFPEFSNMLLEGNTQMQTDLPYTFDAINPKIIYDDGIYPNEDGVSNLISTHRPEKFYDESIISIVMESRFTQPWPNISEKTLNAMIMLKPFVLAAAPGTLSMLRSMGFMTFSKYWDESYDNITLNDERMVAICNVIESISKLSVQELKDMYIDMLPILRHNLNNISSIGKYYKKLIKNQV